MERKDCSGCVTLHADDRVQGAVATLRDDLLYEESKKRKVNAREEIKKMQH